MDTLVSGRDGLSCGVHMERIMLHYSQATRRTHEDPSVRRLRRRKGCREPESLSANAKAEASAQLARSDGPVPIPSSNCLLFWFLI